MIKAVLFDVDGTLVNSLGYYLEAYKAVLKSFGWSFEDREVVRRCFGQTEERICEGLGIPEKAGEFRERYFAAVREGIASLELFTDVQETLEELKRKQIHMGLVTFAYRWYAEAVVKKFGLDRYAEVVISFDDVQRAKPDPEAVAKACSYLEVDTSEALVVGDSKSDVAMGKNAGSKTALYTPEENRDFYDFEAMEKEAKPDWVVSTLKAVVDLVGSN